MTKAELIEALNEYPDDIMIVIPGHEGGRKEVEWAEGIKLKLNVNTVWYYGPHEEESDGDTDAIYIH
jgi:hypothetical protein